MARQTYTRAQLRRDLAVRLTMPYALRVPGGYAGMSAAGTTLTFIDTANLVQNDDFWNGQWAYITGTDGSGSAIEALRKVVDFASTTGTITLDSPLSTTSATTMAYELHSVFNAVEMHNAINKAIQDGYPAFFDTVENSETIIVKNKLDYTISGITPAIATIHGVWLERPATKRHGVVVSSSFDNGSNTTSIILEEIDLSDVDSNWMVSCYYGSADSEGDSNAILTAVDATNTITVYGDFSTYTVGDEVLLWDTKDQHQSWYPIKVVRFSPKEWPSKLYLDNNMSAYLGSRLKILYSTVPQKLTDDASTTIVPEEFIMLSAMATLFSSRMNDNRVDRQMYASLAAEYEERAARYKQRNVFRGLDTEIWMEPDGHGIEDSDNPLDWN